MTLRNLPPLGLWADMKLILLRLIRQITVNGHAPNGLDKFDLILRAVLVKEDHP